ncbi:MAG: hypothetical protein KY454_04760 [Actinobacteria bacterium]|nr:hypothetical protein [Actinomycetota bacterium]MBW3649787.1 hypothetical protein [Actinomycetota bacterium]
MGIGRRGARGDKSTKVGPSGLEQPDVVDYVVEEADGAITLRMTETRPWDGGPAQVDQLMAKLNSYVAFIRSGDLEAECIVAAGRPVRIVLQSWHMPQGEVTEAFPTIRDGLAGLGIEFDVEVAGGAGW